jgi:hypothetical protein
MATTTTLKSINSLIGLDQSNINTLHNNNNNYHQDQEPETNLVQVTNSDLDKVVLTSNSLQQMFKNEIINHNESSMDSSSVLVTNNNNNNNTTHSSGSGRFHAIRNWLKMNRWRKKSEKSHHHTPEPPPARPFPSSGTLSAHNSPHNNNNNIVTPITNSIFSSLFDSNQQLESKTSTILSSKKGTAKFKLKESNVSVSGGTGSTLKKENKYNKNSKCISSNISDKLNNTITSTGTYSTNNYSPYGQMTTTTATTPRKNISKVLVNNSTPVSTMVITQSPGQDQDDNNNSIEVLDQANDINKTSPHAASAAGFIRRIPLKSRLDSISTATTSELTSDNNNSNNNNNHNNNPRESGQNHIYENG